MNRHTAFLWAVASLKLQRRRGRIDRRTFARRLSDAIHTEAGIGTPADRFDRHVAQTLEVVR